MVVAEEKSHSLRRINRSGSSGIVVALAAAAAAAAAATAVDSWLLQLLKQKIT